MLIDTGCKKINVMPCFSEQNMHHIEFQWELQTECLSSLSLDSPVVLIFMPVTYSLFYGWIVSITGQFTHNIRGPSSMLSCNRCYGLWPILVPRDWPALLARSGEIPVLNGFVNTIDWDQNQSDLSDLTLSMCRAMGSLWIVDFRGWTWPEVAIPGAYQKEHSLCGREWVMALIDSPVSSLMVQNGQQLTLVSEVWNGFELNCHSLGSDAGTSWYTPNTLSCCYNKLTEPNFTSM